MANHNLPTLTSTYSNFVSELDGRLDDLAVGMDPAVTTVTNPPTNSIRWNSADKKWEKWSGTAWNDLSANYAINLQGPSTVSANSSGDALKITQTGTGNALVVEDSANPDSTPFVVNADGRVIVGHTSALTAALLQTPYVQTIATNANGVAGGVFGAFSYRADTSSGGLSFNKSRATTPGTNAIVSSGDDLGIVRFSGDNGTAFIQAADIQAQVDGTPGTNDMPGRLVFRTTPSGSGTPVERMRIDSAGNVGIGLTPTAKLDVRASTSTDAVRITQTGTGNALVVEDSSSPDNTPFVIDADGRVIIGDRVGFSPFNYNLQHHGDGTTVGFGVTNAVDTTGAPNIRIGKSRGTKDARTAVLNGDETGVLRFHGFDGVDWQASSQIIGFVDGSPGAGAIPGRLVFSTAPSGGGTPVERMRITSGGALVCWGDVRTATVVAQATSPTNSNTSATATASSLLGGIRTGTPTASINLTLPTGTNMDAAFTSLENNMAFEWSVINLASATHTITLQANTNHTVVGNMVVAANNSGRFLTRKTTTDTFITYRIA